MFDHSFYKVIIYDRPGCNQANCSLNRVSLICTGVCVCIDQGVQHRLMPLIQNKNSCLHQNRSAKRFCQPFYSIYMKHLHTWPYMYICISTLLLPASKNSFAGLLKSGVTSYLGVLRPRLFTFTRPLLRSRTVRTL